MTNNPPPLLPPQSAKSRIKSNSLEGKESLDGLSCFDKYISFFPLLERPSLPSGTKEMRIRFVMEKWSTLASLRTKLNVASLMIERHTGEI